MEGSTLSIRRVLQRYDRAFHLDEPKTARSRRTIVLPRPVGAGLREHRSRQLSERLLAEPAWQGGECGDLVFTTETGEPLHGKTVTRRLQKLLSEAGMPRLRFHDLRHTAATLMLVMGVPLETIQETLGTLPSARRRTSMRTCCPRCSGRQLIGWASSCVVRRPSEARGYMRGYIGEFRPAGRHRRGADLNLESTHGPV